MMLHLSVGWTVFDVIDQRVTGKSWKINSKVRRDQWRPTKNPPMTKLVFLWFWMLDKCSNVYLFVDQCFYSTPTKQSSPFTLVNDFGSNHYNCLWYRTIFDTISFGLIGLTVVGNGSHQFYRLRSEVWCPMSKLYSLLRRRFCSRRDDLKSPPTCFALDEISPSRLSRADVIDQDDPSWTSLELEFF